MVVQPRFEKACWCSGRIRGRGEGLSGSLVLIGVFCCSWCLEVSLLLCPRSREMNFVMDDER